MFTYEIYFHTEPQSCKDNNDNICVGCLGQYDICHKLAYERCIQLGLRWCPGEIISLFNVRHGIKWCTEINSRYYISL